VQRHPMLDVIQYTVAEDKRGCFNTVDDQHTME
jgi:hypothetical protein